MQPTRFEKAVRWLLLVGFVIMSGMGSARSNCCCIMPLAGAASCNNTAIDTAKKPCCQKGQLSHCQSSGCDSSKCSSEEACSAECGCGVTDGPQLAYKETESPVSKVFVTEGPLESINRFVANSIDVPQQDRSDPAINAQEGCSLMCTWQK